jgi:hypothetical protein
MNIFYLSESPVECAQAMVDRHVVKMILETAQLLSTAHRVLDGVCTEVTYKTPDKIIDMPFEGTKLLKKGKLRKKKVWKLNDSRDDILYSATHINHPSAIWARESVENYLWLVDHLFALGDEYTYRYGKIHLTMKKLGYEIQSPPYSLKEWDMTLMPSCMDKEYIISDEPIVNYRNYYAHGKKHLHAWKRREPPAWIDIL